MKLPFIHREPPLTKIRISNTDFLVDGVRREFRDANNPHNTIPFGKLQYNEGQGGYELLFDKLTRNKYEGYMPEGGVPPMTERVYIPRLKEMEQMLAQEATRETLAKKELQEAPKRLRNNTGKRYRI